MELKTLYFNFEWLSQNRFLCSISRKRLTIEVSVLGELMVLSFARALSQLIMRVNKPTFAYKLALQLDLRDSLDVLL